MRRSALLGAAVVLALPALAAAQEPSDPPYCAPGLSGPAAPSCPPLTATQLQQQRWQQFQSSRQEPGEGLMNFTWRRCQILTPPERRESICGPAPFYLPSKPGESYRDWSWRLCATKVPPEWRYDFCGGPPLHVKMEPGETLGAYYRRIDQMQPPSGIWETRPRGGK